MIIKIDIREQELITSINKLVLFIPIFKQLKVITENLPLGDVIIADDKDEKLVIERKTIGDLLASIKDGRYEEQSYRLNGSDYHNHNIIYLIEGDINRVNRFKDNRIEKTTFYSSLFSLNYYKGFSVLRTFSIEETAFFICNTILFIHCHFRSNNLSNDCFKKAKLCFFKESSFARIRKRVSVYLLQKS
jgi:ERCC4-type nuclease